MFFRNHSKISILYGVYAIQFIISLLVLILFFSIYNLDGDIVKLTNHFTLDKNQSDQIQTIYHNSSKLKNMLFIVGYEGFKQVLSIQGLGLFIFAINACVIFPILTVFTIYLILNFIWIYIISKIRRNYKYEFIRTLGKWGFITTLGVFLISILIGLGVIISSKYEFSDQFTNDWFSKFNSKNIDNDFISHTSIIFYFLNFNNLIVQADKSTAIAQLANLHTTIQYSDLHFMAAYFGIYIPIIFILLILFLAIFIACFLSKRNNDVTSSLTNWLGNVRIDSLKEFRAMFFKNPFFWVLSLVATASLITPVLLSNTYSGYEIIIIILTIIAFLATFIPLLICYIRTKCMISTSFNTYMFVMMNLHLLFTIYVQILGYALMRGSTIVPFQIFIFQIITIYAIQITTFVLFIRSDK